LAYQFHAYWVFRGKTVIVRPADDGRPALAAGEVHHRLPACI